MKQDEIIEMAKQAGIIAVHTEGDGHWYQQFVALEAFAKLVAAKERGFCYAKAEIALLGCDKALSDKVLKAIRARGEA